MTKSRSSGFGHVDKLPSGRWRARYTGPDGRRRTSTFRTKTDARAWLATAQADVVRQAWRAPEAGRRTLGSYAAAYLTRNDLRESTRALYAGLWRHHLEATWSTVAVADVTPQAVRSGMSRKHEDEAHGPRAVLPVAPQPALGRRRGRRHRGQPLPPSLSRHPEAARSSRSLTVKEVQALARAVPGRSSALVVVLALEGFRFGGATALRRLERSPGGPP